MCPVLVHDTSSTGATVVEKPATVVKSTTRCSSAREEENEIGILAELRACPCIRATIEQQDYIR